MVKIGEITRELKMGNYAVISYNAFYWGIQAIRHWYRPSRRIYRTEEKNFKVCKSFPTVLDNVKRALNTQCFGDSFMLTDKEKDEIMNNFNNFNNLIKK